MAGWDDILRELGDTPSQTDIVRRKYLKALSNYTGRNTIAGPRFNFAYPWWLSGSSGGYCKLFAQ